MRGHLAPGQRIIEGHWARKFGVAQTSVREAINLLISEGFATKASGRSARVTSYSEADIAQIYELRGALEGLAANLTTQRQPDLEPLETALKEMRKATKGTDIRHTYRGRSEFSSDHVRALWKPLPLRADTHLAGAAFCLRSHACRAEPSDSAGLGVGSGTAQTHDRIDPRRRPSRSRVRSPRQHAAVRHARLHHLAKERTLSTTERIAISPAHPMHGAPARYPDHSA